MGRKIPGSKHLGVKDPLKQQDKRNKLLKNKINAPPSILDFQEMPSSVHKILKFNEAIKDRSLKLKSKKKKKRKANLLINTEDFIDKEMKLPGMTRPEKPVPSFVQQPGESDRHFLHRIEGACNVMLHEVKFENKFGVTVNEDPKTGKVTVTKDNDPVILYTSNLKDSSKNSKKEHVASTKKEKRKQKEREMKMKQIKEEVNDFDKFHDHIKFGEFVHAPPSFKTLPKKAVIKDETARPGKKDLLLKSVLQESGDSSTVFNKKEKNWSSIEKEKKELKRIQAVEAYRMLKVQKKIY